MHNKFAEMAKQELEEALSIIPSDTMQKFLIFTETVRVLDYWSVLFPLLPKEKRLSSIQTFTLLQWGWNLAVEHLYKAVEIPGAFPITDSTEESKAFATDLLCKLGQSVLLYRASEMIKNGFLEIENSDEGFIVRTTEKARDQFLDNLEFSYLNDLEIELNNKYKNFFQGWQIIDIEDYPDVENLPGYFFARRQISLMENYKNEDIDKLMIPLIFPWDSGHGVMTGYGALPEVDSHFLAEAVDSISEWRNEAGFHPNTKIGNVSGADITGVITFITSFYLKHIRFALLAMKYFPNISFYQSLTIWEPLNQLEASIAEYSNQDINLVKKALEAVTLQPNEAPNLHNVTKHFMPLLISLGNGVVLRPVSSIFRNPFLSTITLLQWKDLSSRDRISAPREEWMRSEIYHMFQGTRYRRVDGNIKIRNGHNVITDIDGAIYDTLTGELALFQFKWQDYFTNDVRELRSRAGNLTKELDEWAHKVEAWIEQRGKDELTKTLRLKLNKGMLISSIYLFGISRTYARTRGFGFTTGNKNLAIANWPQFLRARYEIGPADRVFHHISNMLKLKMNETISSIQPLPFIIKIHEKSILFEDMWNVFGDDDE